MLMEDRFYTVVRIDGDYAVLLPDGGLVNERAQPLCRQILEIHIQVLADIL